MAEMLHKQYQRLSADKLLSIEKQSMFERVLAKMRDAIATEIEKPNGKFSADDLQKLSKEMYR